MITETSRESYKEILEDLGDRQLAVFQTLRQIQPANNLMISQACNVPLSSVCGRMNELRNDLKLVTFSHKDKCPITNKNTNYWKIVNHPQHLNKENSLY
jgi:hypothetical protein